jgi:hypothetical protein
MPKAEPPLRKVYPGKGGVGRAHWRVTPTGIAIVRKMAANGCKLETIAAALGCAHDALQSCRQRQPEVQDALDAGRAAMHDELVDILMQHARAGQFVPAIFLLKSRFGYREGAQLEVSVDLGGVLVVPAEMTVEEYIRRKQEAGELDPMPPMPMRDVTPDARSLIREPIEHLPEAPIPGSREPAPRPVPSGTTVAPFPGPRTRRGD